MITTQTAVLALPPRPHHNFIREIVQQKPKKVKIQKNVSSQISFFIINVYTNC